MTCPSFAADITDYAYVESSVTDLPYFASKVLPESLD